MTMYYAFLACSAQSTSRSFLCVCCYISIKLKLEAKKERSDTENMGGVAWTEEEDHLLKKCIEQYGEGKWHRIPHLAGKLKSSIFMFILHAPCILFIIYFLYI